MDESNTVLKISHKQLLNFYLGLVLGSLIVLLSLFLAFPEESFPALLGVIFVHIILFFIFYKAIVHTASIDKK